MFYSYFCLHGVFTIQNGLGNWAASIFGREKGETKKVFLASDEMELKLWRLCFPRTGGQRCHSTRYSDTCINELGEERVHHFCSYGIQIVPMSLKLFTHDFFTFPSPPLEAFMHPI